MNRLLLVALFAMVAASSLQPSVEAASTARLQRLVKDLEKLYKKAPGSDPVDPTADPLSGADSGEDSKDSKDSKDSGEKGPKPGHVMDKLEEIQTYIFLKSVREALGSIKSVCFDLHNWVHEHEEEDGGDKEGELEGVKRKLRSMKRQTADGGDGAGDDDDDDEEDYHFAGINWVRLYFGCMAFIEPSPAQAE